MFTVYILQCIDSSYYIGHTEDLDTRVEQHQSKYFPNCYTATRLPVLLVHQQAFYTKEEALIVERQIKEWSRKKKQALINNNWQQISKLARSFC